MITGKTAKQTTTNLFTFRPIQSVLVGIITLLLFLLIAARFTEFQRSRNDIFQVTESMAGEYELNIVISDSTAYVAKYRQWLSGLSTRRDVQIRRALLAQRLVVDDTFGVPSGERVPPEYLKALSGLDLIVFSAKPGYLSSDYGVVIRKNSEPILDRFLTQTRAIERQIVVENSRYQRTVVEAEARHQTIANNFMMSINLLILAFALSLAISRSRDYRKARSLVLKDHEQLLATQSVLERSRQESREQMEIEEAQRQEVFRLDSLAMPILSRMRKSVDKHQIIDEFIAGVGMSLGADWVIFHSFPTPDMPRIFTEWRSTGNERVDQTEFLRHEEALKVLATNVWNGPGIVMKTDFQLVEITKLLPPSLFDTIRKLAKARFIVPLGEGSQVFGYISVLMYTEQKEWSSDEILFVRSLAANASHLMIQLRSLEQSKVIAEQNEVMNRLIEIDKIRTNFIGNVNHELRTPLTSIIGYLEIIQESAESDFDPDIDKSFKIVMRNARRLQKLVENTLLITSLDGGHTVFETARIDLGVCLRDLMESFVPLALDGEVTVNLVIKDKNECLSIDGNRSQMEQVFTNLISNAIKFTPKTGTVTVTAQHIDTENGAVIEVTVHDTGIGIPAEEADGLFQRFTRGSNALDAQIQGTGLGLTIVKEIVELHRGSITFTSRVGEGTEFTVRLPVDADSPV